MISSADRAYEHIKSAIVKGRYGSGLRLTEDMVAASLGISRTPVRDAMRRLHSEGFIEITPNSGARVACWDEDQLNEITQMRVLLEGFAAELSALKIEPPELTLLARLCDDMEGAFASDGTDLDTISGANLSFHQTIVEAAGNGHLSKAISLLWTPSLVIRKYGLFDRARMERSFAHHREIIAALKERDPNWAGAAMRAHILASRPYDAILGNAEAAARVA